MTGIVPNDLAHPTATKYKDEPVDHPSQLRQQQHSISGHQGSHHLHLQHPGPPGLAQKPKQPESPHQSNPNISPGSYGPHTLGNGVLHHQHPYSPQPQDQTYYTSHPSYTTASAPGQFPSSGPQEIMATTQMHRPYPPMYHTPQSSSPASVASQTHEQHNRSLYTQSPQMTSTLYGYQQALTALNPVQPSPYGAHPSPQQHPLTSQSLMMPHQTSTSQLPHQSSQPPTNTLTSPTTATVQQPTPPQRALLNPPHPGTGAPLSANNGNHQSPNLGASSSAAPGPIPATTPLVVRQDSNGVQWIAFEYSRDRVKMEYTIRCDVESVNVDNLSQEFKTENCVYPRACCNKDQYRGNRLVYETECNAVGWALADLNPALRGKRGLIQRAVDSWRNSNQDPRLRSRRVRRMAKMNRRQGVPAPPPPHMAPTTPVTPGIPSSSLTPVGPRPQLGPLTAMGPPQLHHHHAQPDGNVPHEEVSGPAEFTTGTSRPLPPAPIPSGHSPTDIRTAQVFHGYPAFPLPANSSAGHRGPSIPPLIRDGGIGSFGRHPAVATSNRVEEVEDNDEHDPSKDDLFGTLPEGKRRKFILVDDTQRGCRVRVKVMLDQVDMNEIPDSYRMSNSVYPRTYFPVQMKSARSHALPANRYIKDDTETNDGNDDDDAATVGRILVPASQVDDGEIAVPIISRRRHRKEVLLNDLGYRMSWSQSRVFAGRMLFLQRSLDAYRNKMRSTMLAAGQEPMSIPPHFETRAGKRRFLERRRRTAASSSREAGGAHALSASQHDAEEVEP
ncbi:hypothetical protein BDW59DRAFT_117199 [Aspergillus cavernicola]|uniref:DUF8032 domain-containing protein n=1 Tax=Aspergillus cavernicola TaxID=176166 RepID=A0ABR4HYS8_9EURO